MVGVPPAPFAPGELVVGVVSGSGINLRPLLDEVYGEYPFADALGVPGSVVGHDGVFVFGRSGGVALVLQAGRLHLYEGHPPDRVAATVDRLYGFGVRELILTNAVGGLDPALRPGQLVRPTAVDTWPYRNHKFPENLGPDVAIPGCDAAGRYVWMHGPCYETRAEIRALQAMGAVIVGMSLPLELARCRELGIVTGVVCCVTNDCTRPGAVLTHEDVVATAARASTRLAEVLRRYLGARSNGDAVAE